MGIFDFFFKKKKNDIIPENKDIIEGLVFCPTLQLRTPLEVLKKYGEVFRGSGTPPKYGQFRDGIWVPKVKKEFDLGIDSYSASDACGSVKDEDYIQYAVGLLTIFQSNEHIDKKMDKALNYSNHNSVLQNVEKYILKYYDAQDITEVMARFITTKESLVFYFNKPGNLHLVNGVNKTINNNLQALGINTIKDLAQVSEEDLIKIKGIGKVSAKKITTSTSQLI